MLNALRQTVSCLIDIIRRQGGGFVIGVGLALVFAIVMSKAWPHISVIFDLSFWSKGGSDVSRLDIVRNLSLLVGGGLGIGLAVWRSYTAQKVARTANQQVYLVEQGQITDRFSSAIKMLTSENPVERIGAIYTLARVSESNVESYHIPVMQILLQFIEGYATNFDDYKQNVAPLMDIEFNKQVLNIGDEFKDLIAAIKICSNRNKEQIEFEKNNNYKCIISNLCVSNINISGIKFSNITIKDSSFVNCNFSFSSFDRCVFTDTEFVCNNIFCVTFEDSEIVKCKFDNCYMHACLFHGSGVRFVEVFSSNCCDLDVRYSYLFRVKFSNTDFTGSIVESLNISNSTVTNCRIPEEICGSLTSENVEVS